MRLKNNYLLVFLNFVSVLALALPVFGQQPQSGGDGSPPARKHTVTQSSGLRLLPSIVE